MDSFQKGLIFSFGYAILVRGIAYGELFVDSVFGTVIKEKVRSIVSPSITTEGFYLLGGGCFDQ